MANRTLKRRRARVKSPNKRTPLKGRSNKRKSLSHPSDPITGRIPPAIEFAIGEQRGSLATAISLLYCLHSALRREIEDGGKVESEAVDDAADGADLTEISAMLLVQLNAIHNGLDTLALLQVDVNPEWVRLAEAARKLQIDSDEREVS